MKNIIPPNPSIGICISTYGSVPYVELILACLHRYEPQMQVLIHDDSSRYMPELRALAKEYDADIFSTEGRRAPAVGDLSGFAQGLRWADEHGLDIVVKCSRRFVIDKPWSVGLGELMHGTQYATASGACAYFGFGFRSELVAMHVPSWTNSGIQLLMAEAVRCNEAFRESNEDFRGLPEAWLHKRVREVHRYAHRPEENLSHWEDRDNEECDMLVRSERMYPRPESYDAFAWWVGVMGIARTQKVPGVLWHDCAQVSDYYELAQSYGLKYGPHEFVMQHGK